MKPKQLALVRHKASPARTRGGRWRGAFLKALAKSPSITVAARASGISRQTAYNAKNSDPIFAAKWQSALDESIDELEHAVYEFAKELKGCDPGTAGARVKAAECLLRAHRRSVFGDKSEVDLRAALGVIILPAKREMPP